MKAQSKDESLGQTRPTLKKKEPIQIIRTTQKH